MPAKTNTVTLFIMTDMRHVGSHQEQTSPRRPLQVLRGQGVWNLCWIKPDSLILNPSHHAVPPDMIAQCNRFDPIPLVALLGSFHYRYFQGQPQPNRVFL